MKRVATGNREGQQHQRNDAGEAEVGEAILAVADGDERVDQRADGGTGRRRASADPAAHAAAAADVVRTAIAFACAGINHHDL